MVWPVGILSEVGRVFFVSRFQVEFCIHLCLEAVGIGSCIGKSLLEKRLLDREPANHGKS